MTIRSATVNFILYAGSTFTEIVTLRDENGALVDLTGYTAKCQARRDISDTTPMLDLTTSNGGIALGGAAGTIQLNVAAATSAGLTLDYDGEFWVYDLQLINGSYVERTLQGAIMALPAVTRA